MDRESIEQRGEVDQTKPGKNLVKIRRRLRGERDADDQAEYPTPREHAQTSESQAGRPPEG